MNIFKPKIIINKKKQYLKVDKKINFFKIFISVFLLFFFIILLKYIKPIIEQYNIYSLNYFIGLSIIILLFIIYCFSIFNFLSNEILELNNKKIRIQKSFLSLCYYNKEIFLEKIVKITYQNYRQLIVINIFNNESNNIIIQANTSLEEDEEFYFGVGINLQIYGEFLKVLKEILNNRIKDIEFIYYE
ncbi:hypothetical protein ACWYBU_02770 [Fusobacterium polymorphum]